MEQVEVVADDLKSNFWSASDCLVANSFGGYLFLHAQANMPAFPGRVLLLSPIVGEFEDEASQRVFWPPYPERLKSLADAGAFPRLPQTQIHVGELDWQSVPSQVLAFGKAVGIPVTVVENAGHMLGKIYVGGLLDRWLPSNVSV